MRRIALPAWLFVCMVVGSGMALAQDWTIATQSGDVRVVRNGVTPVALTEGGVLRTGDWVETAADGRLVLVRGEETIVVGPSSRMGLPEQEEGGFATRILQQLGTLLFRVEKQPTNHFEVETPFLAAVVKGTTFTVSVDSRGAAVHVTDGAVQVDSRSSRQRVLVRPGSTARVDGLQGGLSIEGPGEIVPIAPEDGGSGEPAAAPEPAGDTETAANGAPAPAPAVPDGGPTTGGGVTTAGGPTPAGGLKTAAARANVLNISTPLPTSFDLVTSTRGLVALGRSGSAPGRQASNANALGQANGNPGGGNALGRETGTGNLGNARGNGVAASVRNAGRAGTGLTDQRRSPVAKLIAPVVSGPATPGQGNAFGLSNAARGKGNSGNGNAWGVTVTRGIPGNPGNGNAFGEGNGNPGNGNAFGRGKGNQGKGNAFGQGNGNPGKGNQGKGKGKS